MNELKNTVVYAVLTGTVVRSPNLSVIQLLTKYTWSENSIIAKMLFDQNRASWFFNDYHLGPKSKKIQLWIGRLKPSFKLKQLQDIDLWSYIFHTMGYLKKK